MNADATREVIAREIWAYNECPWDFDNPPEGMAQLQKRIAVDQAERIRAALEKNASERGKAIGRLVMTGPDNLTREKFLEAVCAHAKSRGWPDAMPQAEAALDEFLRDEKIEYGDAGYGWADSDAYEFADEMLLRE